MMLSPAEFQDIVTGRRRGVAAACWRGAFRVASWIYEPAVRWQNRGYDRDPSITVKLGVPVIAVGNLTLGGTGKTPCVEWICRYLRDRDVRVAIVSRGYGAEQGGYNDEARELEQKLPDVPHVQNPDRIAAGTMAIEEFLTQCLVLDDAFQHRRVARDLNLLLVDATEPYGLSGAVSSRYVARTAHRRGTCRRYSLDPLRSRDGRGTRRHSSSLRRTRAAGVLVRDRACPDRAPRRGRRRDVDRRAARRTVAGFCGIGNPDAFRRTLEAAGATVVEFRDFPDHHDYSRDDVAELQVWAAQADVDRICCTHKDLVKIGLPALGDKPFSAVRVGLRFLTGEAALAAALESIVAGIPADDLAADDAGESNDVLR
ncbi:MAG: tetraacyldisaccharide 4'-kinase [Pirellulales bacterium]